MASKITKYNNYEWIDLLNPDQKELHSIAEKCNLNFYNLIDSLEPNHLPKFETDNDINFLILRIVHNEKKNNPINNNELTNKIAIFYNSNFVVTIHRIKIDFLNEINEKHVKKDQIQSTNSLVIKIIWNVLQTYNHLLVSILDDISSFENTLFLEKPSPKVLQSMYLIKRKTNTCKKMLILSDDVISSIRPMESERGDYQDIQDLYIKLTTLYDQVSENLNNLLNLYISLSSQKTNEIMKTLTIFSIFFLPLSFISGLYGMNFKYMPELERKWGYPTVVIVMLTITTIIYYWLKRKKWL